MYNYYKPKNPVIKYVLLGGGDDTGLAYEALGARKFTKLLLKVQTQVKKGRGEELVKESLYGKDDEWFSYQAAHDILNPDGDYNVFPFKEYMDQLKLSTQPLFRHYKSIKKLTLVVYGSEDEYCYGKATECVEILKSETSAIDKFRFKVIKDADHAFHDKWPELAKMIATWIIEKEGN